MAETNGKTPEKKSKAIWKGFINVGFSKDEKQVVSEWVANRNCTLLDTVTDIVEAGYKFTVGYDDYKDTYVMALTGQRTQGKYDGYCISLFHSDLEKLSGIAAYVVGEMLEHNAVATPEESEHHDW